MSTEENKAIVVQLYEEIFNKGDLNLADKLIAPTAINHDPQLPPGVPGGPQGLKAAVTMLRSAFPDDHHTIEDLVAEGDKVVVRLTHTGTHQGSFLGRAPTGKHIANTSIHIFRFADGKLVEAWANRDDLGLLQQLGAIPAPGLEKQEDQDHGLPGFPGDDTGSKGVKPMTTTEAETNKAQFRRTYEEMFHQGNLAVADELIAPDCINHEVPPGMNNRGPESARQVVTMLRTAFPDLHFTIEELVAEGDTVVGRVTMSGTHLGPFIGIAPTGRSVREAQVHFVRFRDGKGIEHRAVRDDLGMMQQLGVISTPGQEHVAQS